MATVVERGRETKAGQEKSFTLTLTRVIRAPRERVFAAWTRPEMIRRWFGSATRDVTDVQADGETGGAYSIRMSPDSRANEADENCPLILKSPAAVRGEYLEVSPYDRVRFTWNADWAPGEESIVTVSLRDVEGGTELKLEHTRLSSEQSENGHRAGWSGGLDKLARLLEGGE